jgi:hypothetical protein
MAKRQNFVIDSMNSDFSRADSSGKAASVLNVDAEGPQR